MKWTVRQCPHDRNTLVGNGTTVFRLIAAAGGIEESECGGAIEKNARLYEWGVITVKTEVAVLKINV